MKRLEVCQTTLAEVVLERQLQRQLAAALEQLLAAKAQMASEKAVEFALLVALVVLAVEKKLRLLVAAAVASDLAIAAIEDSEFVMLLDFD